MLAVLFGGFIGRVGSFSGQWLSSKASRKPCLWNCYRDATSTIHGNLSFAYVCHVAIDEDQLVPLVFCSNWALVLGPFNHFFLLAISLKALCILKDIVYYLSWAYDLDSYNKWYTFISFGPMVSRGWPRLVTLCFILYNYGLPYGLFSCFLLSCLCLWDEPTILHGVFFFLPTFKVIQVYLMNLPEVYHIQFHDTEWTVVYSCNHSGKVYYMFLSSSKFLPFYNSLLHCSSLE